MPVIRDFNYAITSIKNIYCLIFTNQLYIIDIFPAEYLIKSAKL